MESGQLLFLLRLQFVELLLVGLAEGGKVPLGCLCVTLVCLDDDLLLLQLEGQGGRLLGEFGPFSLK